MPPYLLNLPRKNQLQAGGSWNWTDSGNQLIEVKNSSGADGPRARDSGFIVVAAAEYIGHLIKQVGNE